MSRGTRLLIISMAERAQRDAVRVRIHVDLLHGRLDLIQSALMVVLAEGFSEEKREFLAILEKSMTGKEMKCATTIKAGR